MFLKHRVLQAEYFDSFDRPMAEIKAGYQMLGKVNRLFHFASPFQVFLPRILGQEKCRSLSILDLGAGDGSLGDVLSAWAARRGWDWKITNLDMNEQAMKLNPDAHWVVGSATSLPFVDQSFDAVIASQMTHHLMTNAEACKHFSEAWRVTRQVLLLNDLHRNLPLYFILWGLLHAFGFPKYFLDDGLLSVKRSWRVAEWQKMLARTKIPDAKVWLYGGARLMLQAQRDV